MPEHEFGKHEAPTIEEIMLWMQDYLREMGKAIKESCPPGMGFALLVFEYGPGGNMFYTSSARREDVLRAMGEFVEKNSERS